MQSRRASRELPKPRSTSLKPGSDSNDVEDISSQSLAGDSGDHSRKSNKAGRQSSHSSKRDRRTDEDTEDYFSDVRHKTEISSKKRVKSASKESIEEILSDEVYEDKDDDTSEHKRGKKQRKSKKRNESNSYESTGDRDSSVKKDSAKSKKKKHHDKPLELPITEILRKAQEQQQRTKYEDPAPLPELTTNTIYVQGRNGFSAIKIGGTKLSRRSSEALGASMPSSAPMHPRPIRVAIVFQKIWRCIGFIFQGLLGGMALLHLIFMETYFENSEEFVTNYSALSEIYTSVFSFLIAMCIISTFDKFDLAHIGLDHLRAIFKHQFKSILAIPLYLAAFSIHQVTLKVDDKLTLLHYNSSNITYYPTMEFNDTRGGIEAGELRSWQRMTLSKDALAVLGWIFVSLGSRRDMLLTHLEAMSKYANPLM